MIITRPLEPIQVYWTFGITTYTPNAEGTEMAAQFAGVEDLDVAVDIYDGVGEHIEGSFQATDCGNGLYGFEYPAEAIEPAGLWRFTATADSDELDFSMLTEFTYVSTAFAPGETWALDPTVASLLVNLAIRLNDAQAEEYSAGEKMLALNLAYRATVVAAKCRKIRKEVHAATGIATYNGAEVFEPLQISIKDATDKDLPLRKQSVGDLGAALLTWDSDPAGTPVEWAHMEGSTFMLHPAPGAAFNGLDIVIYGYAAPDPFTLPTDTPGALPDAYAVTVMLDRAEWEARKMRSYVPGNQAICDRLDTSWQAWCSRIAGATGGKP